MTEETLTADEVWPRIQRWLGSIYLEELYWLARGIAEACEVVIAGAPAPPNATASYIRPEHELVRAIHGALSNAARLRLLVTDRRRWRDQDPLEHAVQVKRTAWLRDVLAGLELDVVLDPEVRHSLEHFDEYLDRTGLAGIRGEISTPTMLPVDFVLGRDGSLEQFDVGGARPTVYPIRVYLAEERVFVNAGERIDLDALRRQAASIVERVGPLLPEPALDPARGSGMVLVLEW
jgi:hypothetical protein